MLNTAIKAARGNPVERPLPRLACVLTDGHSTVIGFNSRKTHPLQARFSSNPQAIHLHAEIDAIQRAVRLIGPDLSRFDMYVARVYRDGEKALAKPCEGCMGAISAFGIRNVFWTE